jgi:hypothetical protein
VDALGPCEGHRMSQPSQLTHTLDLLLGEVIAPIAPLGRSAWAFGLALVDRGERC